MTRDPGRGGGAVKGGGEGGGEAGGGGRGGNKRRGGGERARPCKARRWRSLIMAVVPKRRGLLRPERPPVSRRGCSAKSCSSAAQSARPVTVRSCPSPGGTALVVYACAARAESNLFGACALNDIALQATTLGTPSARSAHVCPRVLGKLRPPTPAASHSRPSLRTLAFPCLILSAAPRFQQGR